MAINNISEVEIYTVCLYREKFFEKAPIGSGILICIESTYYLISAYHVFDMEEEQEIIDNDPNEEGIEHDDMENIFVKCGEKYFCVNEKGEALVGTVKYDRETKQDIFTDDTEWCVCELSEDLSRELIEKGKLFYNIDAIKPLKVLADSEIIISGYPGYASKREKEEHRSFKGILVENYQNNDEKLFRVRLDRKKAYCFEHQKEVEIPKVKGIGGMSGGGLWYKNNDHCVLIGIILKQDSENNFVEGYNITKILKSYIHK